MYPSLPSFFKGILAPNQEDKTCSCPHGKCLQQDVEISYAEQTKSQRGNWAHPPFFVKIPSAAGTSDLVSWEKPNTTCQSKLLCWILLECPLEYPTARCWHPPHVQHLFRSSSSIVRINGIWISSWWFQPI